MRQWNVWGHEDIMILN